MSALTLSIARIAHEVNMAYCAAIGDHSQTVWEDAPEWQQQVAIESAEMHLTNPNLSVSAAHDAWLKEKRHDGWTYGPIENSERKEHPRLVPYIDLPPSQRVKDFLFRGVVHAIAREQARPLTNQA